MNFKMEDRLIQGFIAGVAGWPPQIVCTAIMYKLHFYPVDTNTALSSLITASIWSIGMTWTLLFLKKKYGVKNLLKKNKPV